MTNLEHALAYAERGWPVIPLHTPLTYGPKAGDGRATCSCGRPDCESQGKHPRTPKGLTDASTDPAVVSAWWAKWPDANIGLRTGDAFDVLDLDTNDALDALNDLEPGPMVLTGRGVHLYLTPTGTGNRAGIRPGIDWRGFGGYVVAPPSVHHLDGKPYQWSTGRGPDTPLGDAPAWITAPARPELVAPAAPNLPAGGTAYGTKALEGELGRLGQAPEGTRNDSLNKAAFRLGALVAGGELERVTVETALATVAAQIGLTATEAAATIASGITAGMLSPRSAPERSEVAPPTVDPETGEVASAPVAEPVLRFRTLGEVAQELRDAPPPSWLIRRLWPADAYGILGAEDKAGKTWMMDDLATAVASGGSWCGRWPVDTPGAVLVFAGEGSERKTLRRLYAIGEHYGLTRQQVDALPIRICHRVPNLTDAAHLAECQREITAHPPRLVILDPLYLAVGDADSSQLNKMGAVLGAIQHISQSVGAALIVAHHWNKTGTGTGRSRFTGAGAKEWGRVLVSMSVLKRRTESGARSVVDLKLEVVGDEIADEETTLRRTVWADDPDDLTSPMHYAIEPTLLDPSQRAGAGEWHGPTECMAAVLAFFAEHPDEKLSKNATTTRLRALGLSYRDTIIGDALERLAIAGDLSVTSGPRGARQFTLANGTEELDL